jgi:hypothetical protein
VIVPQTPFVELTDQVGSAIPLRRVAPRDPGAMEIGAQPLTSPRGRLKQWQSSRPRSLHRSEVAQDSGHQYRFQTCDSSLRSDLVVGELALVDAAVLVGQLERAVADLLVSHRRAAGDRTGRADRDYGDREHSRNGGPELRNAHVLLLPASLNGVVVATHQTSVADLVTLWHSCGGDTCGECQRPMVELALHTYTVSGQNHYEPLPDA